MTKAKKFFKRGHRTAIMLGMDVFMGICAILAIAVAGGEHPQAYHDCWCVIGAMAVPFVAVALHVGVKAVKAIANQDAKVASELLAFLEGLGLKKTRG